MGCTWSVPVDRTTEDDLVGAAGRHHTQINIDEVPLSRVDMVALEVQASRQTVYRRRVRRFKPNGSLDYGSSGAWAHLRNLLDEPVGRFYMLEFAQEKKLPDMATLVDAWTAMHKVKAPREPTLAEILARAEREDGIGSRSRDARTDSEDDDAERAAGGGGGEDPAALANESDGDARTESGGSLRGMLPSEAESMAAAEEVLATYVRPEAPSFLGPLVGDAACKDAQALAEDCLAARDVQRLRARAFAGLQNRVFRLLLDRKFHERFREHSEYKRYKLKFARVYNAVQHRDFDFMSTLGKGSFGRVLRVRKKTTGRQYALKVMSKKKILSGAESADQVTIERNVLVVCDCPSVVRVEFAFQTSRALFLALELLDGRTLLDAMHQAGGALAPDEARFLAAQMALGLEHLHKHGILYRDLKPVNVMLDARGNAVLTDMGLCAKFRPSQFPKGEGALSSSGTRLTRRKSMTVLRPEELKCVGTFGFRAPEVLGVHEDRAQRTGYGPAVDWWALGVTLHLCMTGKMPYGKKSGRKSLLGGGGGGGLAFGGGGNPKDQERRLQSEVTVSADLPPDAAAAVRAFLAAEPVERLGTDPVALRAHAFFAPLDWERLARRELEPVFRPSMKPRPAEEAPQFDGLAEAMYQFSQDNVMELFGGENEMQDEYTHVGRSQQRLFREWDYLPDELFEDDWKLVGEDALFD